MEDKALIMLTAGDRDLIFQYAYVPEHLTGYVIAITGAEPFLFMDHLVYLSEGSLIFVGYPLRECFEPGRLSEALELALKEFRPKLISLLAPSIPSWRKPSRKDRPDAYYRIDLLHLNLSAKLRNMIGRASRELSCERGRELREEHVQLIREFSKRRDIEEASRYIFQKVPDYVCAETRAFVFSSRNASGNLADFTVADYSAKDYGFYMFNFTSRAFRVPGGSDFLLHQAIQEARQQGKSCMNLGLGINKGVTFFKEKWGAAPFLPHESCTYSLASSPISGIFKTLLRGL